LNRLVYILLLLLVLLAPLPLGSNREWAWTLCALITAWLALAWVAGAALKPRRQLSALPTIIPLLFMMVCAWVLLQISGSIPPDWQHPLWEMAGEATGKALPGSISVAREDSLVALQRLVTYGLVFFLTFQLCRNRNRAGTALRWIALAGLAYAIYGLAVYWGEFGTLLWFRNDAYKLDVRGTFVNRNSFATYLGLCVVCALCGLYRKLALRRNPAYEIPDQRQWNIERFILQAWKPLAALLLMLSALILTHSRAGFTGFMFGGLAMVVAVHYRRRISSGRSLAAIVAAFAVTITAFVLTSEVLLQRMDRVNLDWPGRMEAYTLTSGAISDNPLLGFGYGTYADSFRLYRDATVDAHLDKAHNTYLENIFELGWPAAAALFLCFALLAGICFRGLRNRGRDWIFPAAGLAATVLVSVHSLFDFSLQIPAISMTYACIMGVACAQSYSSGSRMQEGGR
jgi:O-antigen ligase